MGRRKRKSKWKWMLLGALALLAALAVTAVAAFVLWPRDRITWENFERLQPGMRRAEVEAILGPAEHYPTGRKVMPVLAAPWASRSRPGVTAAGLIQPTHVWTGKILSIWAIFNPDDVLDFYTGAPPDDDIDAYEKVPEHIKREMFRNIQPK